MDIISPVHCRLLPLSLTRLMQLSLLLLTAQSQADDSSVIGSHVVQSAAGRVSINQAAGHFNIQSNSHALGQRTEINTINYTHLSQSECYFKQLFTAVVVTLHCSLHFFNYQEFI